MANKQFEGTLTQVISPKNGNKLIVSSLKEFYSEKSSGDSVAVKYVHSGKEKYEFDNNVFQLQKEHYLVINPGQVYKALVNDRQKAVGFCIDISKEIINDVYNNLSRSSNNLLANPFYGKNRNPDFFENTFNAGKDILGARLKDLATAYQNGNIDEDNSEIFHRFAHALIDSQYPCLKMVQGGTEKKLSTTKELYRRVLLGKEIIDDSVTEKINIETISEKCMLSRYHFIRTFKRFFGTTPYEYYNANRMRRAKTMIESNSTPIQEIAYILGYPSAQSFNKSFKKAFKVSPSLLRSGI
jgi:AraC family transcriptional regulator